MKTTKIKMSTHVVEERLDRLTYIAMNIGFGKIIIEHCLETKRECITDTGIILVKDLKEDFLITAFVGTIDKVSAIYHANGYERIPTPIYNKVIKNTYHVKRQNVVKY
jgi:hypothetical protein